jgi:hypothetical protein
MRCRQWVLIALGFALLHPLGSRAAQVTIGPSKDNTIFQNNVNNSSGAGNGLFAGTNGNSSPRRGLIAFDIAGSIPAGSMIQSVQLTMFLGQIAGGSGPANAVIDLRRLNANWGEGVAQKQTPPSDSLAGLGQGAAAGDGDATWNARLFSATNPTLWTSPGGDFANSARATSTVGTTLNIGYTWASTAALVSDVQGWLNAPATNFGWDLVNEDETSASTLRGFYSRETATATLHPQLQVTFQPIPEPSGVALAILANATLVVVKRRRLV